MTVGEWIAQHPGLAVTVPDDWSLQQIVNRMLEEPYLRDLYVISENRRVVGHLSHKKLAELVLAEHRPVHTRRQFMHRVAGGTARELMDAHFVSAHPDEELDNVLHRQLEHDMEDMPVIDDQGQLVGAVNLRTVLRDFHRDDNDV